MLTWNNEPNAHYYTCDTKISNTCEIGQVDIEAVQTHTPTKFALTLYEPQIIHCYYNSINLYIHFHGHLSWLIIE